MGYTPHLTIKTGPKSGYSVRCHPALGSTYHRRKYSKYYGRPTQDLVRQLLDELVVPVTRNQLDAPSNFVEMIR